MNSTAKPLEQDPRAEREGICGVTVTGATGLEWICIRKVHAKWEDRHRSPVDSRGNPAQSERHYYVRRYPNRPGGPA